MNTKAILLANTLVAVLLAVFSSQARDYFSLESTYLGNGIFEYTLTFPDDRYWDQIGLSTFDPNSQDFVEITVTPPGWSVQLVPLGSWAQDQSALQATPYQCVFRARSDQLAYRTAIGTVAFAPHWRDWARPLDTGTNLVTLYANVQCLIPATAAESDGSATNVTDHVPGFPELQIQSLVTANNAVVGVKFAAGPSLPVQIQASNDLQNWTTIANTQGTAGTTTWTSSLPVGANKTSFYRLLVQRPSGQGSE
jgi:hypothetical protein